MSGGVTSGDRVRFRRCRPIVEGARGNLAITQYEALAYAKTAKTAKTITVARAIHKSNRK